LPCILPHNCFVAPLLPHHVALLPHLIASCFIALPLLAASLPCLAASKYLLTPPHLLPRCLVVLVPCCLCWLVLPSSFLFYKEELGAWRSKLSNNF
jgi:hypothetical protein